MRTHNLCFGSKIRKICIPFKPQFYNINVGYTGIYITQTCLHDEFVCVSEKTSLLETGHQERHNV